VFPVIARDKLKTFSHYPLVLKKIRSFDHHRHMDSCSSIDAMLALQDRGENCFVELSKDYKLQIVADLDRVPPPAASGGGGKGKKGKSNKATASSSGVLAKCVDVVLNGITISVELTRQTNLAADAEELRAQSNRSSQVQRAVTWSSIAAAGGRAALRLEVDVAFALLSSALWSFEETLGCGIRAILKLSGDVPKHAPVAMPAPDAPTAVSAVNFHEGVFQGKTSTGADGMDITTIEVSIPPFFLDPTKGLQDAPGTETLRRPLASGAMLTLSIRRDTTKVTRPVATTPEDVPLVVTRGSVTCHASARKSNTKNSAVAIIELSSTKIAAASTLEGWKPVVVMKGFQVCVSVDVSPTEPAADNGALATASGEQLEEDEDAYRVVYDCLRSQDGYGLPTLKMADVFAFAQQEGQLVDADRVRDATRRYILSARRGSPERPRRDGHGSAAVALSSHDF
jgi:hypothetical protein